MRKLLLKCSLALGDIVMMTAAVRDLHACYPGQFLTDVRTLFPALWQYNPYLTPLSDQDPEAEHLECSYPLINRCNEAPYHCLHGFIDFLNDRLSLRITPTAFKGDVHLSPEEKVWYSQVRELTGQNTPFWLISAGGKYDITIKWWDPARYQAVVDYFRGTIQFVQVGSYGHHHPKLNGVIDLRGKTDLRQLLRLVHHAQGVLCPVTSLMHLAAAVEPRRGGAKTRPCVVIAGGREPVHWEAYPDHQFVHTNGALPCCTNGGCWKDRSSPLRDGDERDRPERLCVSLREDLPHCMDLITPADVIRRIEWYFQGPRMHYLTPRQRAGAEQGVRTTARNPFDQQPLHLHSAGLDTDRFIRTLTQAPAHFEGRGIVLCLPQDSTLAQVKRWLAQLRRRGCHLPVQVWSLEDEPKHRHQKCVPGDPAAVWIHARRLRRHCPARLLGKEQLPAYALWYSSFREVLLMSELSLAPDLEALFLSPHFNACGALFWPEHKLRATERSRAVWRSCGLRRPREPLVSDRQVLLDKQRCWRALRLALWFYENADFYHQLIPKGGELFHVAFRKLKQKYCLLRVPRAGT